MTQNLKKRRDGPRLPKDILERSDHDVMEVLFGKQVVRELDKLTAKDPKTPKDAE